jgi:zinc/manganese transport system permease protein
MIERLSDAALVALPLLAGLLVLSSHVLLGAQVLRRGIVFIDLAIAQLAALGAILFGLWFSDAASPAWGAVCAALAGASLIALLAKRWPAQREALIGLVHVAAAALALIAISFDPHGAQRLRALLAGDILWVSPAAMMPLALATAAFLLLYQLRPRWIDRDTVFYCAFAVLISLSLPIAGVYLVFASLIAPALAGWAQPVPGGARSHRNAWGVGLAGYGGGLALSLYMDWPTGPSIVLALALSALLALGLASTCARPRPD